MAFDSAEKRRSASALLPPFGVGVTPIGTPTDQEWRQQAGWGYSGIATETGAPAAGIIYPVLGDDAILGRMFGGLVIR